MIDIKFNNLGPIETGQITLNDLTILCGNNNTGKTYVTNSIYSIYKEWTSLIAWQLPDQKITDLAENGFFEVNIEDDLISDWEARCRLGSLKFPLRVLPEQFATSKERFEKTKFDISLKINEDWQKKSHSILIFPFIRLTKDADSPILKVLCDDLDRLKELPKIFIKSLVRRRILDLIFPINVFLCTAERTGATAFRNRIKFDEQVILKLLQDLPEDNQSYSPFNRDYASPIEDNLRFLDQVDNLNRRKRKKNFLDENPDVLDAFKKITSGSYKIQETTRDMIFCPNAIKDENVELRIGESSTSVRSLLMIWYWLHFMAQRNQILMIDEPELNLHPKNQRLFSRFIALLVKKGIKVFITTHSDYIIRELNNLILMNHNAAHMEAVKEKNGYESWEDLDPKKVNVYVTKFDHNKKCIQLENVVVDPIKGININSFDDEIIKLNNIQDALLFGE
ncbi:AAA family ATPase [Acinetobacter baumannii]|jgi:energy-coupling factor transporter ATP-binding protein EcfA2|uniref:AAA family ATPase n=1 Tax=Acinetobacter baumannii TaxID=470 RepID=UPI00148F9EA9|nr:AAA family ATPase [Acinetobacter baumannii]NOQ06090.1 AAA family ATPase [Acinetobacter baumannii]